MLAHVPPERAADRLDRVALAGELQAVVVADGQVIGLVTTAEIGRFIRQSRLRRRIVPTSP